MNKENLLSKNNLMITTLIIFILFFGGVIFADINGVWHETKDVQGGTFAADEMDVTSYFRFIHPVYFDKNIELRNATLNVTGSILLNGTNIATLDSSGKVPLGQLPFHKGDLISPLNRQLISGQAGYDAYYFDITNLAISENNASNVKVGTQFGVNNMFTGTYTSDANATSQKIIQGNTAYVNGVKMTGTLSLDSVCSSAGGSATCGATSSITPGDFYAIVGANSPTLTNYCTKFTVNSDGSVTSVNMATAGICKLINSCTSASQTILNYPDLTSCGTQLHCISGSCVSMNFIFNDVIVSNTLNYNLKNSAINAGWDQIVPLVVTIMINSGVVVGSSSTSTAAFDTGDLFPAGSSINIINNGYIVGKGGTGGNPANPYSVSGSCASSSLTAGASGGTALSLFYPVTIENYGVVGGGGGGGGAAASSNGGFGPQYGGNGGGGAGYGSPGTPGDATWGTLTVGGAGGSSSSCCSNGLGGAGGDLGGTGANGVNYGCGSSIGGNGGAAVVKNGNIVTWITYGDIRGAVN